MNHVYVYEQQMIISFEKKIHLRNSIFFTVSRVLYTKRLRTRSTAITNEYRNKVSTFSQDIKLHFQFTDFRLKRKFCFIRAAS